MAKIIKNQTGNIIEISDTGVSISPTPATYLVPEQDYLLWAASSDIIIKVASGDVVISNGSEDLSISDAISLIKGIPLGELKLTDGTNHAEIVVRSDNKKAIALDIGDSLVIGPQGPQGDQGIQGPQGAPGPISIFGSEYQYTESEAQSTTTSGSYQNKLKLTTSSLVGGTYKIQWFYEVYTSDSDMNARVQLDDISTLSEHEHTSVDEYDKHFWVPISGFKTETLSTGVHTIDIDYNDDGGGTAYIRRARIEIWRVS